MSAENKPSILLFGTAYMDLNAYGLPLFEGGMKVEEELVADKYQIILGGSALNCARVIARLGLEPTFVGKIGDDEVGQLVIPRLMEKSGIVPALIAPSGKESVEVLSNVGINFVDKEGDAVMAVLGTANKTLTPEEFAIAMESRIPAANYVYMSSLYKMHNLLPAFEEIADAIQKSDAKMVVDHGRLPEQPTDEDMAIFDKIRSFISVADIYFPSEDELKRLMGGATIEENLHRVRKISKALTIVKAGKDGAYSLTDDNELLHVPAFQVHPTNTVGAGDTFNAGVLVALEMGKSVEESMEFGCATAALKISREELPTQETVEEFLQQQAA